MKKLVSNEMLRAGEHTALMWARVTSFSFTGIQTMVRDKVLLLWSVLTMAAIRPNVSHLAKAREDAMEDVKGCGSNNQQDPRLVSASNKHVTCHKLILSQLGEHCLHSYPNLFPSCQSEHNANCYGKCTFHYECSLIPPFHPGVHG